MAATLLGPSGLIVIPLLVVTLSVPGYSLVRLGRLNDPLLELTLGVALGISLFGLVSVVSAYLVLWNPPAIAISLLATGILASLTELDVWRRLRKSTRPAVSEPTPAPQLVSLQPEVPSISATRAQPSVEAAAPLDLRAAAPAEPRVAYAPDRLGILRATGSLRPAEAHQDVGRPVVDLPGLPVPPTPASVMEAELIEHEAAPEAPERAPEPGGTPAPPVSSEPEETKEPEPAGAKAGEAVVGPEPADAAVAAAPAAPGAKPRSKAGSGGRRPRTHSSTKTASSSSATKRTTRSSRPKAAAAATVANPTTGEKPAAADHPSPETGPSPAAKPARSRGSTTKPAETRKTGQQPRATSSRSGSTSTKRPAGSSTPEPRASGGESGRATLTPDAHAGAQEPRQATRETSASEGKAASARAPKPKRRLCRGRSQRHRQRLRPLGEEQRPRSPQPARWPRRPRGLRRARSPPRPRRRQGPRTTRQVPRLPGVERRPPRPRPRLRRSRESLRRTSDTATGIRRRLAGRSPPPTVGVIAHPLVATVVDALMNRLTGPDSAWGGLEQSGESGVGPDESGRVRPGA